MWRLTRFHVFICGRKLSSPEALSSGLGVLILSSRVPQARFFLKGWGREDGGTRREKGEGREREERKPRRESHDQIDWLPPDP